MEKLPLLAKLAHDEMKFTTSHYQTYSINEIYILREISMGLKLQADITRTECAKRMNKSESRGDAEKICLSTNTTKNNSLIFETDVHKRASGIVDRMVIGLGLSFIEKRKTVQKMIEALQRQENRTRTNCSNGFRIDDSTKYLLELRCMNTKSFDDELNFFHKI